MTGINYKCLGSNEEIRERRYTVLTFYLKGAKPKEIAEITGNTIRDVYEDISYLRSHPLHDLPLEMIRDFGKSFFEIKITELERRLKKYEESPSNWIGIQKLILQYKTELLKLTGASVEKIDLKGDITLTSVMDTETLTDPAVMEAADELANRISKARSTSSKNRQ